MANLNERESIGLPNDSLNNFYQGLEKLKGLKETIVLNTCNRTEIYGAADDDFEIDSLIEFLAKFRNLDLEFIREKTYLRTGSEVVRHLFEVASGIDSQMVGETEILGQIKKAYDEAVEKNRPARYSTVCFKKVFRQPSGHAPIPGYPEAR